MKRHLLFCIFLFALKMLPAQITTPIIKAGFGVDAELRANYFDGFIQAGNDDWFANGTPGTGKHIIDTTGAAAMVSRYATDATFRKQPFFRTMSVPQYSIVNNRVWIDAVYIRDYNGQSGGDETAFVNSNKNGDNPNAWNGGVTSVLDKNDIAEMMVHVRRDGPRGTDPLWFFGGLSLQGTTGNRYFDFELYQTDIFYTRSTGKFSNYGPDAGHTSWQFDASGNVLKPGDVIFSAEYSSSSLTFIEARVWVHRSALSLTPSTFDWSGQFDGASNGADYGYASIKPKVAGTYYTGMQSGNNTWAGPFGFINDGNAYQTTYSARQFMEFSVNLTFLGLDPLTLLGGGACGLPFRRILVKTRSSTSFSAELKDFIGPFDFFTAPQVDAQAEVPFLCSSGSASTINVLNPLSASVYTWTTPDGRIVGESTGPSITVDSIGTYIVSQQLLDGCGSYARDTVLISNSPDGCQTLATSLRQLKGTIKSRQAQLNWPAVLQQQTAAVLLQRSTDGSNFQTIPYTALSNEKITKVFDDISDIKTPDVYYRLLIKDLNGSVYYSNMLRLQNDWKQDDVLIYPNPAIDNVNLLLPPAAKGKVANISVVDAGGATIYVDNVPLASVASVYRFKEVAGWKKGMYMVSVEIDGKHTIQKLILINKEGGSIMK